LLLGLRRHAIGSTLGRGRDGELAYISEKYTLNSDPGRGVLSMYLMGTLFGALFFSFFAPVLLGTGLDVRALAIASGMGSASMMTAASSTLAAQTPDLQDTIVSYAAASQLLTSFIGTYTMVFLAVPLQRAMYNLMIRGNDHLPAGRSSGGLGATGPASEASAAPSARGLFATGRYATRMGVRLLSVALMPFTQQMKLWVVPDATPITTLVLGGLTTLWLFSLLRLVTGESTT